jgi:macrolide resistance protein
MTTKITTAHRHSLYGLLAAHTVSLLGNSVTMIALPWYVLETTGSAARVGAVAFAQTIPLILSSFFGGVIVDRLGHRWASIVADLASMVTIAAVPLLAGTVGLPFSILLVLAALGALLDAPGGTARESLLPEAIRAARIRPERANATFETVSGLASLVGPSLAGLLLLMMVPADVLWVNAATFAISALLVRLTVSDRVGEAVAPAPYLSALLEGLRWTLRDASSRSLIVYATAVTLFLAPLFAVVMPVYMREEYGNALGLGLFLSGISGGTIAGAILYGAIGHRLSGRWVFVGGLTGIAIMFVCMAFMPPLSVLVALGVFGGMATGPTNPLIGTVLQARVPEHMRGRVFGTVGALAMAAAPVGIVFASPLLEAFDAQTVIALVAAATVVIAVIAIFDGSLRSFDRVVPENTDALTPRSPSVGITPTAVGSSTEERL